MSIVRHEQVNHRGEAVPAAGPIWDGRSGIVLGIRAALAANAATTPPGAAGEVPGPEAEDLERAIIAALREVRSVRTRSRRRVPCHRIRR